MTVLVYVLTVDFSQRATVSAPCAPLERRAVAFWSMNSPVVVVALDHRGSSGRTSGCGLDFAWRNPFPVFVAIASPPLGAVVEDAFAECIRSSRWCCRSSGRRGKSRRAAMMSPQLWQSTTSASRRGARAGAGRATRSSRRRRCPVSSGRSCSHCSAWVASSTPGSVGCMRSPMVSTRARRDARAQGTRPRGAEDVVGRATTRSGCRDRRLCPRLEAHVGEHAHERLERHAVLQAVAQRDREPRPDAGQGRTLLGDLQEELTGTAVFVLGRRSRNRGQSATRTRSLAVRVRGSFGGRVPARSRARLTARRRWRPPPPAFFASRGLGDLAVVAVERDGLQPSRHAQGAAVRHLRPSRLRAC